MRYEVIPPTEHGFAFFTVIDTASRAMPNRAMVSIQKDTPHAAEIAQWCCQRLNGATDVIGA